MSNSAEEQISAIDAFVTQLVAANVSLASKDCRVMGNVAFVLVFTGNTVKAGFVGNPPDTLIETVTGQGPTATFVRGGR
jgi:hypothetical protein